MATANASALHLNHSELAWSRGKEVLMHSQAHTQVSVKLWFARLATVGALVPIKKVHVEDQNEYVI